MNISGTSRRVPSRQKLRRGQVDPKSLSEGANGAVPVSTRSMSVRRLVLPVVAILFGLVLPLLILEIVLRFLPVSTSTGALPVNDQNPLIRYTPNQSFVFSKGWKFDIVNKGRVNNYGFINDQDYSKSEAGAPLSIIGDSYVEALMVPYAETVQGRLARQFNRYANVYSFGISGAQLPQYLAYAEFAWKEFHPRAMVFLIIGNDFDESVSAYKDAGGYHVFEENTETGDFRMVRKDYNPGWGKKFIRQSALARYLWGTVGIMDVAGRFGLWGGPSAHYVGNTAADASAKRLADSRKAVDQFFLELPGRVGLDRTRVLFVVDAMRPQIYSETELAQARGSYFDLMRRYFLETAAAQGYEAIDMEPRFQVRHKQEGARFEFAIDGHWNSLGHEEAARAIEASQVVREALRP